MLRSPIYYKFVADAEFLPNVEPIDQVKSNLR